MPELCEMNQPEMHEMVQSEREHTTQGPEHTQQVAMKTFQVLTQTTIVTERMKKMVSSQHKCLSVKYTIWGSSGSSRQLAG